MKHYSFVNVPKRRSIIDRLPLIFDQNPSFKDEFISYAKENVVDLSAEIMVEDTNDTMMPKLVDGDKSGTDDQTLTREMVLAQYRIKNVCIPCKIG